MSSGVNETSQGGSGAGNPSASQTQIATGPQEAQDIAPISELKVMFQEIKRIMDRNLQQSPSIEQFKGVISALNQRYLGQEKAGTLPVVEAAATDAEEAKTEEAKVEEDPLTKYLYDDLIPDTASRLPKHGKSTNEEFTKLVGDTMLELCDLLATELRLQTPTSCKLVEACRPIFDQAQPFFYHHYQKDLPQLGSTTTTAMTGSSGRPADVSTFSQEDIDWRNNLVEGNFVDVVKHDMALSVEGWARGEISIVSGTGATNLGDANGDNIKRFSITYQRDSAQGLKVFRADSPQIAPYDSKTKGEEWRFGVEVADMVDVLDQYGAWSTCTIVKKNAELTNPLPTITVGFRRYTPMGENVDNMGAYFGKGEAFDLEIPLYSIRVQKAQTVANFADPDCNIVWKFQAPQTTPAHTPSIGSVPGGNPPVPGSKMITTTITENPNGGQPNKPAQPTKSADEKDMDMITEETPRIWAAERYSCKSTFLASMFNRFGQADGFENLLAQIIKPDQSIENVHQMVAFFVKSQSMYHKQFVDDMYERLANAIEQKLLSLTSDQLRLIKLSKIEEIITQIWQTLLIRKINFIDLQVLKSQVQVKISILFMKQPFLEKRIDGAKIIDTVCKKVITEVGAVSTGSVTAPKKQQLLQQLVDILNEAKVLDLFFSRENIHSQLVQRSGGLFRLFFKKQALSQEEIEMIWTNCQSHESMALDLATVLGEVTYAMEAKDIIFYSGKLLAKSPASIKPQEVDLMLSMSRRTGIQNEELANNQGNIVRFFWNYLFDAAAMDYLDKISATKSITSLAELIKLSDPALIRQYFGSMIEKIRGQQDRSYFCIVLALTFIRMYVDKDELTKEALLNELHEQYGMIDLLISDLSGYIGKVKACLSAEEGRSQVSQRVFFDLFPHSDQLEKRFDLIKEFASQGQGSISTAQLSSLWTNLLVENPISEDHKIIGNWFKTISDDFMLGRNTGMIQYEDLLNFFKQTICDEGNSFVKLSLEGYHCIQGFFILVNLKADKLVVLDDDVARKQAGADLTKMELTNIERKKIDPDVIQVCAKVAPNLMDGIQALWKIAIDCQEARVGTGVTSMLLQVHTNVDFGMEDEITSFEDQFIESCLSIIKREKLAIDSRSTEVLQKLNDQFNEVYKGIATQAKIKKVLPVEEKRIVACLSYLKMLVLNSEKDGMNGLIPHTSLHNGEWLGNITINNTYEKMNYNGFRNRFTIQIFRNATVYSLKQKICQELCWQQQSDNTWQATPMPHPWTIKLMKFAGQTAIKDNDNGKTLGELNFSNNEVLSVSKKGTQSVSKMPLITADNMMNDRARFLFSQMFERYSIEHPEIPGKKVLMFKELNTYVQHCTGVQEVTKGVNEIMTWGKEETGKMNLEEFLTFYQDSLRDKLTIVRGNLAHMGYRDDLKIVPPPGSPDNILQARKNWQEMPRYKMSKNDEIFAQIIQLFDLQSEVSKEAQSLIKMMCTNQSIFWNILKLNQRQEGDDPFSWDMVFYEDMKMTMYSLDIIDSIIKTQAYPNYSYESDLRLNWVQRFLSQGGFEHLLAQFKRALELSKESLVKEDFSTETSNLVKKFIDQMLRLMKTFIFAAMYAEQEPNIQDNVLVLKRTSSKIQEQTDAQQQEADQAKKQARETAEEDQFTSGGVRTSVGGPTSAYNPTSSSGNRVYGPQLPPSAGTQSVGTGGDDDLERALKESEDPRNQVVPGAVTSSEEQTGSDDNFEETFRFKQIVEQIRDSQLASSLIQDINFGELQEKLMDMLSIFVAKKSNSSKEEGNIISSALSLWSAAIVQKPELIADFFSWSRAEQPGAEVQILNASDFVLNGIYSPKNVFVRNQFRERIELICEKVTLSPEGGQRPLFYILRLLMNHFPSFESEINTHHCSEYFTLFGALIKQYQELIVKEPEVAASQQSISILDLLKESFNRLREHSSSERDSDSKEDSTLIGLLILVKELLGCFISQAEYQAVIEFSKRHFLLHEFFYENLYYMPERTTNTQNKCKTNKSREHAYKLLYKLMKAFKPKEMTEFLEEYLWPMIKELPRPKAWKHQPSNRQRSAEHKQAGINNLGNICYMISMLQQFFMVPQFRYQILKAIDTSAEDIKEYKERKVDDNLLRQFQRLFGNLELSERAYVDPFDLCFAYKDLTGEPTNVAVQCDSQEFLTFFFDRMEDVLRGTSQKYLLQDVFQATYVEQKIFSNGVTKNEITTGYTLSVQVENTKDLYTSIQKVINGEVIEDVRIDGSEEKYNMTKRQLLGQMPNVLIVHLQRIVFDYNTFGNKKVNSKFDFPKILDMSRFSFKEQMSGQDPASIKGATDKDTAELQKLLQAEDEDYIYRLVGVNIHRGVADSGHYWSMINTKRGKDEPDPAQNKAEWLASNNTDWKKFDDETVSSYMLADLERDSFGGDTSNLTEDEQYISSTAGGAWGKSAYMLIYEKQRKKPIREVNLSESQGEEEKVELVGYRDVEPYIPDWLRTAVQKDNTEFVIDRQVFNTQFFKLIMLVLKHISADLSMTQHQYPLEYIEYFNKMHQVALKIGQKVMFDFLSHYHENSACLSNISDYMSTIFTFSDSFVSFVRKADEPSVICDWIEQTLLADQCTYFFHLMFNCPDKSSRLYCGKIVASTVNKGFKILAICESKPEEKDHPKVVKLRTAINSFMKLALDVIHTRESQKNWTRLEQFYIMLQDICNGGKPQAEYLLGEDQTGILVRLIDMMLQDKSPKAKDEPEKRVEMGGSVSSVDFGPLASIVCNLVMCMSTATAGHDDPDAKTFREFEDQNDKQKPAARVCQQVQISDEALEYFTNPDFITIAMSCSESEAKTVADAFAHVCFRNKKLTKDICRQALKAINVSDYSRISSFLKVVQSQLVNADGLRQRRLEWIFGFPFLNTGLQQGEVHKIGLDSLHHDVKGEVFTFRSMLTHDPENTNSLLHLLWRYQGRMEDFTMTCLNCLADIVTNSEEAMEFFSNLPGVTYQYARYSDWIGPFLTSQLNKVTGSQAIYSAVTKEDIVKVMSKFEIYDNFVKDKDMSASTNEENKNDAAANDSTEQSSTAVETTVNPKFEIKTLTSTPPPFIICQCSDENYLNVVEQDGIMLSISYFKGSYVMSRPTGYTNFAISTSFLASGSSSAPLANPIASSTTAASNKSANAMLAELDAQKQGSGQATSPGYAASGSAPLRVKQTPSSSSNSAAAATNTTESQTDNKDPPKIIVDSNEEWEAIRADASTEVEDYTQTSNTGRAPQEEECRTAEEEKKNEAENVLNESFDNWTGDEMHSCDDLVYKLTLSNPTEQPILFKISFKVSNPAASEQINLNYPINGIKGSLAANEMSSIVSLLTRKVQPGEQPNAGKFELEKVQAILTWKPDVEKIARMAPKQSNSVSNANDTTTKKDTGTGSNTTANSSATNTGTTSNYATEEKVQQLMEMGFEMDQCKQALENAYGCVTAALNYLFT